MLRLWNTLSKSKEVFEPIDPADVRMYVCGPTVYDFAHIGNARPIIVFDLLFRLLRHRYGAEAVTYVRNITDVDDKINARAARDFPDLPINEGIARVTRATERQFHEDIAALGVLTPDLVNIPGQRPVMIEPRATEHIDEMRELIDGLVANGHAYVADGHVLFDVPSMPEYGRLSRQPLDQMEAGARIDVAPYKRSPLDFVLWKPAKPGEPSWPSPAGIATPGRPGWHIECSAMAWKHLGPTFDIHAGGLDLIFPHHENEIAQSRCCFGTPVMAKYWLHNGFLQVEGEKMSKSLGNFATIREVLADWPGEVVRLTMLKTHYRKPIDWTVRGLEESAKTLDRWRRRLAEHPSVEPYADEPFVDALCDDLNTPAAIARVHYLANFGRWADTSVTAEEQIGSVGFGDSYSGFSSQEDQVSMSRALVFCLQALGLGLRSAVAEIGSTVLPLIDLRLAARAAKNWAESDRIRDELKAMGVQLKDNKDGTTSWEVVRA